MRKGGYPPFFVDMPLGRPQIPMISHEAIVGADAYISPSVL